MNYRHHFHAGNFADVFKHVLLLDLIAGMQRKESGFLYVDTHAGRGRYDLESAGQGDRLERKPEHPEGLGRILLQQAQPDSVARYLAEIRTFDRVNTGETAEVPRFYPGSPWLVKGVLREQDRMHLCELHPDEFALLQDEFARVPGVSVHPTDGYNAVRAALPPREKRALLLIDPPFEAKAELHRVGEAVREALRRMPAAVIALWYPVTERVPIHDFLEALKSEGLPPTLVAELSIAGEHSALRMRGCGLVVINPPWQIDAEWRETVPWLGRVLGQGEGSGGQLHWLVRE